MAQAAGKPGSIYKAVDNTAEQFIIAGYNFGLSIQLIQRSLQENSYNLSLEEIRIVLERNGISDDGLNCSKQSEIWKRYLSHIIEIFDPASLEKFKTEGLEEAITFYNIDEEIFTKYWYDFLEFQTRAPFGSLYHIDFKERFGPWITEAFLDFGYNPHSLNDFLNKNGFSIERTDIVRLFTEVANDKNLKRESVSRLGPKTPPYPVITRDFWKAGFTLVGNAGIPKLIEMTEIIGGYRVKDQNIRFAK